MTDVRPANGFLPEELSLFLQSGSCQKSDSQRQDERSEISYLYIIQFKQLASLGDKRYH